MSKICIIGLGYVGLPLALLAAKKGHTVIGIDVNSKNIECLRQGQSDIKDDTIAKQLQTYHSSITFLDSANELLNKSEFIIICVPTPVDEHHKPIMDYVINASKTVQKHLTKGQTIILESTVFPGTMDSIVKPILEETGLQAGIDFQLSYCPERIDPGNTKWNVSNIPRVIGSYSHEGAKLSKELYASMIDAEITILKSPKEAEATKIMENTFRDVNIAFINEMAKSFDKMGVDVLEVIKGASTKPFSFMPHFPGCGVGGHCIPVDPYYLIEDAKSRGFNHKFLSLAREINEDMPNYTIELLEQEIERNAIEKPIVGVYGVAYKKNVSDIRESPALKIISLLKKTYEYIEIYDPFHTNKNTKDSLSSFLESISILLIATDHDEITSLTADELSARDIKLIIDGRNCLDKENFISAGIAYKGIGR